MLHEYADGSWVEAHYDEATNSTSLLTSSAPGKVALVAHGIDAKEFFDLFIHEGKGMDALVERVGWGNFEVDYSVLMEIFLS